MRTKTATTVKRSEPIQWDDLHRQQRVQVFGASRTVGREMAAELLRHGHPVELLELYGHEPIAFAWKDETVHVEPFDNAREKADIAFVCTSRAEGRELVPYLVRTGARVVDLSGAASDEGGVQLVVSAINGDSVGAFTDAVGIPCRTALPIVRLLGLLERVAGVERASVFAVVAAASEGTEGIKAVREELSHGLEKVESPVGRRVGNLRKPRYEDGAEFDFEHLVARDVRQVLGRHDMPLDFMALEGDAERCDTFALEVRLKADLHPNSALKIFSEAPLMWVETDPERLTPAACTGSGLIHVGRIRAGSGGPRSLCFFAVADQLRAGATTAALRVACRFPVG